MKMALLLFGFSLSALAQFQWMPYDPSGDYGGLVPVLGTIEPGGSSMVRRGVCRGDDGLSIRLGKVVNGLCNYGTPYIGDGQSRHTFSRDRLLWGALDDFEVLLVENRRDYAWVPHGNIGPSDLDSVFDASFSGDESPVYICRAENRSFRPGNIFRGRDTVLRRGIHSGQVFGDIHSECYYEYGGKGFVSPDRYVDSFDVLVAR